MRTLIALTAAAALIGAAACDNDDDDGLVSVGPTEPPVDTMAVDTVTTPVDTATAPTDTLTAAEREARLDSIAAVVESDSGAIGTHPEHGLILRTAPARFDDLEGWPYPARYVDVDPSGAGIGLQMHYIDVGPRDGEVVLLMHGNPAWGYLVRDLVDPLTEAGYRVIVPDLIGFGKSDKPLSREAHTYDHHVRWVRAFTDSLDLRGVTLHGQDWGGLIGLRVAVYQQDRFARVAASNTALPDGTIGDERTFSRWRDVISQRVPRFSQVMQAASRAELTPGQLRAYDAPFPEEEPYDYTAGPREMPAEVPFDPDSEEAIENRAAVAAYDAWGVPIMTLFSEDPETGTTAGGQTQLDTLSGAAGNAHVNLGDEIAGHYIREDVPDSVTTYLLEFMRANPL